MKINHGGMAKIKTGIRSVSAFQLVLAIELALLLFCVLQYAFPLHQYVFAGTDLTGEFCTYRRYSEAYDTGCYLDQTLITDDTIDPKFLYITTPYANLPRGSYDVTIVYAVDSIGHSYSANAKFSTYFVVAGRQGNKLEVGEHELTYSFFSPTEVREFQIHADYSGEGCLFLESVTIQETNVWKNILLFYVIAFSLLVDGVWLHYKKTPQEQRREVRLIIVAMVCVVVCSCTPLLSYFLQVGDDLPFHLNRIEGIKTSLLAGSFPNRVSPYWNNGYGYASAVLYGEAFLYLPALLRILGFSVQSAYKVYVVTVNLATALVAYGCFERIAKNRKAAFLGCAAYVLAPYRLVCIYMRAAVGEYTAMLFFPLIFYGLYQISQSAEDEKPQKGWLALLIGYTGLIQCHVISCVIAAIFSGLFCLVFWKRMLRVRRLAQLVKAAVGTLLLNLWFLLPFVDYYRQGYAKSPWNVAVLGRMGSHGAFLSQMLTVFQDGYAPSYTVMEGGIEGERNYALGVFLVVAFFYVCLRLYRGREKTELIRIGDCSLGLGMLAAIMSTLWFPWDGIQQMNGIFRMITRNIQFPWRFLGIACFFLAVLTVCFALLLLKTVNRQISYGALILLGLAFWLSADYCMYTYTKIARPIHYATEENLDSRNIISGEYVPEGTPVDFAENQDSVPGEGLTITEEERRGGTHFVSCQNHTGEETFLDIPFLPYRGYHCYDELTEVELEVQLTTAPGRVRVMVPAGYEGTLSVRYEEPGYWRAAEAVSLFALAAWLLWRAGRRRRLSVKREEKARG